MIDEIVQLKEEVEALKSFVHRLLQVGPIAEVDAQKGYRIKLGEELLSPWLPHPETGKTSVPLKKGQLVGVVNPSGDPRQGFLVRGGYGGEHKTPNTNMDANVFEDAGVKVTVVSGELIIEIGGMTHTFSANGFETNVGGMVHTVSGGGVETSGGSVTHDGKNIGSTHTHGGIAKGMDNTKGPN